MAEEVKDETVNEETSSNESETEIKDETLESAGEVVTSPTVEGEQPVHDYVQLEQRVTSLEQRLNGQEQQQQEPPSTQEQPPQEDEPSSEDSGDDSDGIESSDEIKKILGL